MTLDVRPILTALPLAALLAFVPQPVDACGGTFCDGVVGPNIMPVDQTGESILFWIDRSGDEPFTEAHIQIQYEGEAENFAWIIPVSTAPQVLVGNQALFDSLLAATVPTFTITSVFDNSCAGGGSFSFCMAREDSAGGLNGVTLSDDGLSDDAGDTGGPEILDRGFAGAFEYVTLTGDTVQEIVDWLDQAGYAQDDDAPPILQEYLDDDFVFVAVKLRGGADVDAIHPLAIRYPGVEACIPIKLTRIAAVEDMAIRAFFLADQRTVPQNWPHVVINPAALDWTTNPAASYAEAVSLAIDEAGGRAFITEHAGTDEIVSTSNVDSWSWDPAVFETIDPIDVVDALIDQGLGIQCDGFTDICAFPHPQVESLLDTYLPAPEGMDPYEFWGCLACYEGLIDVDAWSGPGFAADFAERISIPGEHAIAMLASSTYLTRLFTVISPHEMTEDPLFHENDSLGPVDSSVGATRTFACDGPDWIELDDGRRIVLTEFGTYPQIAGMPIIERVERVPMTGPAQVEIDNTDLIDELLADYDHSKLEGPAPFNCSLGRSGAEALLTMTGLFGIAWLSRRRRSRAPTRPR